MNEPNINITNDSKTTSVASWLQRLKDESWEAELLVSTVAIFGTFQLFDFIDWLTNLFINMLTPSQYFFGYMIVFFGLLGVSILTAMFVLHFILRAYWVGLVGLNSVFPDYSIEDSAYSEIYTKKILSILPKLKDSIQKVDELCSVIFSVAFTFMFIYVYLAFINSIFLLVFNLLSPYVPTYILISPIIIIAAVVLFQTLLSIIANLKLFKENEKIQILSFKTVRWSAFLMYGPLYKSILQISMIFGSNFKKKKAMIYLLFSFLFFGIIVSISKMTSTNIPYLMSQERYFDGMWIRSYYASENDNNTFLLSPEIATDVIKQDLVKIFIPVFNHEKSLITKACGKYTNNDALSVEEKRAMKSKHKLDCYNIYNQVSVNGEKKVVDFLKYKHPRTNQFGVLGYVYLTNPKAGFNEIKVKKIFDDVQEHKEWSIPFYYVAK